MGNRLDANGTTYLMLAALAGDDGLVHDCIEKGANLDAVNTYGNTALHIAVESVSAAPTGSQVSPERCADQGLDMDVPQQDHRGVVEALVGSGASTDTVNSLGLTCYERVNVAPGTET